MEAMEYIDYRDILKVIVKAAREKETVDIYYPETENTKEGYREVEPYSISLDVGSDHLDYDRELISPGHILNAHTVGKKEKFCNSFIIGKIKDARPTGYKFRPKWPIEL